MLGMRKGSWTPEEDDKLVNYIKLHGPGRWDYLAKCAGLERNGKSCRLRWLNHLRPDLRHDDFTLEEQLRILELQSQWGNRWSKIAENLPGRTDNEIKNYWRTRVQKRAKDLNYDAGSLQFKHVMLNSWMPRLAEQIQTTFGYDDISTESSTIMNSIHGPLSIKDVGEIHFGHTTSRNTLENKVQTSRPETHGSSHMWDNFPSLNEQSQLESGYGSQCSMIQMDPHQPPHSNTDPTHFFCGNIQEPDNGPFNLYHFNPHVWLPSLNLLSYYSSLSSTDHLSPAASELGHNPNGYPDGFLLAQNDDCLNESPIGSVSGLEFLCDGGIFGHEVKNVLASF